MMQRINAMNHECTSLLTRVAWALEDNDLITFSSLVMSLDCTLINEEIKVISRNPCALVHRVTISRKKKFMMELLKRKDVDVNRPEKFSSRYPLHIAATNGDWGMMKLLLDYKADVNARMESGNTPLHILATRSNADYAGNDPTAHVQQLRKCYLDAVGLILDIPNINIDSTNRMGFSPIYYAVEYGSVEVVKLLLMAGAYVKRTIDDEEPVEDRIKSKMPHILGCPEIDLSNNQMNHDTVENQLFHDLYFEELGFGMFQEFWNEKENNGISIDANKDDGQFTFLQLCCNRGYVSIVDFLLKKKADPNLFCKNSPTPPIVLAARRRHYDILESLIKFSKYSSSMYNAPTLNFNASDMKGNTFLHEILDVEIQNSEIIPPHNMRDPLNLGEEMSIEYNQSFSSVSESSLHQCPLTRYFPELADGREQCNDYKKSIDILKFLTLSPIRSEVRKVVFTLNERGLTPLHLAKKKGDCEASRDLLKMIGGYYLIHQIFTRDYPRLDPFYLKNKNDFLL